MRLNSIAFADPVKTSAIFQAISAQGYQDISDEDWAQAAGMPTAKAADWRRQALRFDVEQEGRWMEALGVTLIVRGDVAYPTMLAGILDAPLALYVRGRFGDTATVAIVGSRVPSPYGRRMARSLASGVSSRGVAIVSGLARGVDSEAHAAALDAGGVTWAVLGSGLSQLYPPENRDLMERIIREGGCVVSEYPLMTKPRPELFPRRNRIVAGLSCATVVVEGRRTSGALVTAKQAAQYGRDVLAVPGPADSALSEAPNYLLKEGAHVVTDAQDILRLLPEGLVHPARRPIQRSLPYAIGSVEAKIMSALGSENASLEELVQITGLDMARLSLIMFDLEIKELVIAIPGQRYAKKNI
jgi:DNA processing protein